MKRSKPVTVVQEFGFTIVEVMIVLAITGLMFVSMSLLISGKQQNAEFQTSVNDLRSQLQQIGNEVSNGYFPNDTNYGCNSSGGATPVLTFSQLGAGVSSSGQCVYLGKVLHFYSGAGGANFSIYTIAGARSDSSGYQAARPLLLAASTTYSTNNPAPAIDVTVNNQLKYGLKAASMTYTDSSGTSHNTGSFAIVQTINGGGAGVSGGSSQHPDILTFTSNGSSLGNDQLSEANAVDSALQTAAYDTDDTVQICFNSGTTDQSATFTLDNADSQFDISTQIHGGVCS